MTLSNAVIAERLEAFATLLDLAGSRPFAPRAYRRAAELVRSTPAPVEELVRSGRARELRGIGPGIETRLRELVETGRIAELDELEREVSPELVALGRYLGLSPQRMVEIGRALDIRTAGELREAAAAGLLRTVPGVGPKTEARLVEALARGEPARPRLTMLLNHARALLERLATSVDGVAAGDPRRWRDTPERLAVVCTRPVPETLPEILTWIERSDGGAVGVTVEGLPVELVVAAPERLGTELVRATGSAAYVEALGPLPDAPTEEAVYAALGIPWCPPELREEPFRGEPPPLVEPAEIRGDVHCHTTWSDGKASVLEMGRAARDLGYEYVAICDHSPSVRVVPGVGPRELARQAEEIAAANVELAPFRVLRGIECDVLPDGSLDLPDETLGELDWVQLSLHAGQRTPRRELTKRVREAMRNPNVRSLSHPKGRIINHRPENALDLDAVYELAREEGIAVEVNGLPPRLDLRGEHVRRAIQAGVRITCSTDAHSVRGLDNMELSVRTARRGWATAADVANTRGLDELLALRRR
jgi:DNA polymerase (family 10)